MKSLADQYGWFRLEAENLPPGVKVSLLGAIDCAEPRQAFLILNRLWERKGLPALGDRSSRACIGFTAIDAGQCGIGNFAQKSATSPRIFLIVPSSPFALIARSMKSASGA